MKRLACLLILIVTLPVVAADLFELYGKKDYRAAEEALNAQLDRDPFDPLSHYNLGVVAQKQGRRGTALYHYLQALQAAPDLKEARNNLDTLATDLHVTIPKRLTEPGGDIVPVMLLFFLFLYLFVGTLLAYLARPGWKLRLMLVPLFMLTVLFAVLFVVRYRDTGAQLYAVALTAAELKSGPDTALTAVGKVREGEVLEMTAASEGWIKAKSFQDNIEGWIHAPQIRHLTRRIE
ncbi:MAG TPA: hypothetical protein PLV42_08880 [bacterium]|nr:hypothetical protein [bacterium]